MPAAHAPETPWSTHELAAGLERLRVALGGAPAEPDADEIARTMAARYAPKPISRMSGWRETPQCGGCKRILKRPDAVCPGCGYANHGGYVGVPATESHLERWR